MDRDSIIKKFGGDFTADEVTFKMGIHHRFTDHVARRFDGLAVLETCTGGGFCTMALARYARHVFTVEINPARVVQAIRNAERAGVRGKVTFIEGDVLAREVFGNLPAFDAAFLDPDWAEDGPDHVYRFNNSNTQPPADALLLKVLEKTENVALILPPAVDLRELKDIRAHERERLYLGDSHELYCLYFGALAQIRGVTVFKI